MKKTENNLTKLDHLKISKTKLKTQVVDIKAVSQECPVKEAVQFLAGAWTLEIYWYLKQTPLRFGELKRSLGSVSPKVLTQRLRDLEDLGVIKREVLIEMSPPQVEYSLTDLGKRFIPAIDLIAEIGKGLIRKSKYKNEKKQ